MGRCVGCGVPCYIECARCYTVLQTRGQPHSCSSPSDEGFHEPDLEFCEECEEFGYLSEDNDDDDFVILHHPFLDWDVEADDFVIPENYMMS